MIRLIFILILCLTGCDLGVGNSSDSKNDSDNTNIINGNNGNQPFDPMSCVGVMSLDGPDGFLWKPVSESDSKPVVLFPASYQTKFIAVYAETLYGDSDFGVFIGFTNPNRQTYRFSMDASQYTGRIFADGGSAVCEWLVPNVNERQD